MFRPAYNRTDRPVVIDAEGRQLGGLEWGAVDIELDEVKKAVDAGELFVHDVEAFAGDASDEAKAAASAAVAAGKSAARKIKAPLPAAQSTASEA